MDTGTPFDWPRDRFYDREGRSISMARWAQLRSDREYTVIGDWRGDNGSAVRTVWTGIDFSYGSSENQIFETHVLVADEASYYTYGTDSEARAAHEDCVLWLSRNTKPSNGPAVVIPKAASEAVANAVQSPRFIDREGNPITLDQWARLRRDPDYCLIGQWLGEGGAHVEVYWFGLDLTDGFHVRPQVFGLVVAAFENCPLPDSTYRFMVEKRAVDHFDRIIPLVECGIRPWDEKAVAAAGFAPLTLRAW